MSQGVRQFRSPSERYSAVAIVLHWTIAAAILLQVMLAWRMTGPRTPESFALIQLHKSVGITILLLSLGRLGWRLTHRPPELSPSLAAWERTLARITHAALYVIMIGMPLTGWLMVSASRLAIPTRLYGVVPWPDIPGVAHLPEPAKRMWREIGQTGHQTLAIMLFALLALHVAGALRHQLFQADEPVFSRMAPGARSGRWLEPRLAAVIAGALAAAVVGWLVSPPLPRMAPADLAAAPREAAPPSVAPAATEPAAPAPAATTAAAAPVRWRIGQPSSLTFETAWSGQPIEGRFKRWRADVLFSPDALDQSRIAVTIDLGSVDTGDGQRDAALVTGDWLGAEDRRDAVFTARSIEHLVADRYVAHGFLQLRGVRRAVDLPFRFRTEAGLARVAGRTSVRRGDFGVGRGEYADTEQIPARVGIAVNLVARPEGRP